MLDIYTTEKPKRIAIGFISCVLGVALGSNATKYHENKKHENVSENVKEITYKNSDSKTVIKKVYATTGGEITFDKNIKVAPDSIIMIYNR